MGDRLGDGVVPVRDGGTHMTETVPVPAPRAGLENCCRLRD